MKISEIEKMRINTKSPAQRGMVESRLEQLENRIENVKALIEKTKQNPKLNKGERKQKLKNQEELLKAAYETYRLESEKSLSSDELLGGSLLGQAITGVLTVAALPITLAMNFADRHPYLAAGIVLGSTIMGAIADPIQKVQDETQRREHQAPSSDMPEGDDGIDPGSPSDSGDNMDSTEQEGGENPLPFDTSEMKLAYRHLNSTAEADATVLTSMSFLDAECETRVLNRIFNETLTGSAAGSLPTSSLPIEPETSASPPLLPTENTIQNAIETKSIWHSKQEGIHQRQIKFTLEELETAIGAAISDQDGCLLNMSIDPDMLPHPPPLTTQEPGESDGISTQAPRGTEATSGPPPTQAPLKDSAVQCRHIKTSTLTGFNGNGEPVFNAALEVCDEVDLKEAQASSSPPSTSASVTESTSSDISSTAKNATLNFTASAQNRTLASSWNSTLAQSMSEEEKEMLSESILNIRAQFCPSDVTLMGDHRLSENNSSLIEAQGLMQELVGEISRLCPDTSILPIDSSNATEAFGSLGLIQVLGDLIAEGQKLNSLVIVQPNAHFQSSEEGASFPLSEWALELTSKGIPVFSYNPDSWTETAADTGYLESVASVAELMARLSPAVENSMRERREADAPATTPLPDTTRISTTEATTEATTTTTEATSSTPAPTTATTTPEVTSSRPAATTGRTTEATSSTPAATMPETTQAPPTMTNSFVGIMIAGGTLLLLSLSAWFKSKDSAKVKNKEPTEKERLPLISLNKSSIQFVDSIKAPLEDEAEDVNGKNGSKRGSKKSLLNFMPKVKDENEEPDSQHNTPPPPLDTECLNPRSLAIAVVSDAESSARFLEKAIGQDARSSAESKLKLSLMKEDFNVEKVSLEIAEAWLQRGATSVPLIPESERNNDETETETDNETEAKKEAEKEKNHE